MEGNNASDNEKILKESNRDRNGDNVHDSAVACFNDEDNILISYSVLLSEGIFVTTTYISGLGQPKCVTQARQ